MGQGIGSSKSADWPPQNIHQKEYATFAAGCFWGLELTFQRIPGVDKTCVGYIGGKKDNPTYEEVCGGNTGHVEAVQMTYDPNQVKYTRLVDIFFQKIDPTVRNRQGSDHGSQYQTGVFYHNEEQKEIAKKYMDSISNCAVLLKPADKFWPAEEYHQQYLEKGGRMGAKQSASKNCNDKIRCYG